MNGLLAQIPPPSFWNAPAGSTKLWIEIFVTFIVGIALIFGLMQAPAQLRRPVVAGVTFLAGLFYVLWWIFPSPIARQPDDAPRNFAEGVSFWLSDAQPVVANFSNVIAAFLIGLGIYSLMRIHLKRLVKQQKDWFYSLVLIVSMVSMAVFGYVDWYQRLGPQGSVMATGAGWGFPQYAKDLLFDGGFQEMEATMFSMVAFYILSAAYRAFRARSTEATILLVTALIVVLSLLGVVVRFWDTSVDSIANGNGIIQNFRLTDIANWIKNNLQTPAIRGLDFGVGVGLLAMGLRIWLSLEKTGSDS